MVGDVRSTFLGIYPKILMQLRPTTETEISELCELLDTPFFTVVWFDVRTRDTYSAKYYANDYEVNLLFKTKGIYEQFDVHLIPVSRRIYV